MILTWRNFNSTRSLNGQIIGKLDYSEPRDALLRVRRVAKACLEFEEEIKEFCREMLGNFLPDIKTHLTMSCIHGIGHQFLMSFDQK